MKLLWHSNSPWAATGYGQQTALFARPLAEHYDLAISAMYGLEGNVIPWHGIPVLPGHNQTVGEHMIESHAKSFFGSLRGGLVVTLFDTWAFDPRVWAKFNLACWAPVDHDPAPPMVLSFFENSGAIPIAMSQFGQKKIPGALYVPHGCDTDTYKPIPREVASESTKIPADKFVVGIVAANKGVPSRKCFPQAFRAFKAFHDRHPESILYLHTAIQAHPGVDREAVNLAALIQALGLDGAVMMANQDRILRYPYTAESMAHIYSSMDVLLSPSAGEGFGIPVLEAAACGVPAIVTDFTAQPEVCGAGWTVKHRPVWTGQRSWQADPDIEDIAEALESAFRVSKAGKERIAKKAREHALQYSVDRVLTEHMLPALAEAQRRIEEREPVEVAA